MSAIPPAIPDIDYVQRWHDIIERRRWQMDTAYEAAGLKNVDYWGRRAKQYRAALHTRIDEDPFLLAVLRHATPSSTLIDVGAGTGRHTLAVAPHVAHVTAVEPSEAMLGLLREDLTAAAYTNVDTVQAEWMDATVSAADLVICSHVLYPIADVVSFVHKLGAAARERVFVYLRIDPLPTDMSLWSEFYGVPLQPQPVALDLINVLDQIGIAADVEVVRHSFTWTFADLDEAVVQARNTLCLREDDAAATAKLRILLAERLVPHENGRLGQDITSSRSAIISWPPAT